MRLTIYFLYSNFYIELVQIGGFMGKLIPLGQKNIESLSGKIHFFNSRSIDRGEGPESEAEMELRGMTSPLMEDATGCANKKEEIEFFKSFL